MYSPQDFDQATFYPGETIADLAAYVTEQPLVTVTLTALLNLAGRKRWTPSAEKLIQRGLDEHHLAIEPDLDVNTSTYRVYDQDGLVAALVHAVVRPSAEGNALLRRVELAAPGKEMVHDMDLAYKLTSNPRPNLRDAVALFNEDSAGLTMVLESDGVVVHSSVDNEAIQYGSPPDLFDLQMEALTMGSRAHDLLGEWWLENVEFGEEARDTSAVFAQLHINGLCLRHTSSPEEAIELRPAFGVGGVAAVTFTMNAEVLFAVPEADADASGLEAVGRRGQRFVSLGDADFNVAQDLAQAALDLWTERQEAGERGYRSLSFNRYRAYLRRELLKME